MTRPQRFAQLNQRLELMHNQRPLLFDVFTMAVGLALLAVSWGLMEIGDLIARAR